MFAMHLMGAERERLKLFSFDEGWRLLGDPAGRTLLASLQRMGRSELAVPIISTQLVTDTLVGERESLENLIGATFVFGMRSEAEAARALALLGLDPEDSRNRAEPAGARCRALPVPRPRRARGGDPGGCGRAVAAARAFDHPATRVNSGRRLARPALIALCASVTWQSTSAARPRAHRRDRVERDAKCPHGLERSSAQHRQPVVGRRWRNGRRQARKLTAGGSRPAGQQRSGQPPVQRRAGRRRTARQRQAQL